MNLLKPFVAAALLLAPAACLGPRVVAVDPLREASVEILVHGRLELSGWFADAAGRVVTAAHGIAGHTNGITVVTASGRRHPAGVVALDTAHDLALLQVRDLAGPVAFLPVCADPVEAGARVWFFGSAEFRHGLLIEGNVARAETTFNYYANHHWITRCQLVAAPSPPGTSGGPWVDAHGRVAGNQSGFINSGSASSGIALVAPARAIRRLLAGPVPPAPSLGCGVEELWTQSTGFIRRLPAGIDGLVTIPIDTNGPAAKAGLTAESVISRADGHPLRHTADLLPVLDAHKPGEVLEFEAWTPDRATSRVVRVTLGRQ